MAIVYDISGRREPYDTEKLAQSNESAYDKELDETIKSVQDLMKSYRSESDACDPLSSIVLIPWDFGSSYTIACLRADMSQKDMIQALEVSLEKAKTMVPLEGDY